MHKIKVGCWLAGWVAGWFNDFSVLVPILAPSCKLRIQDGAECSNTLETNFKHPWNTLETPLNHPWNTFEKPLKHPWNTFDTPLTHSWHTPDALLKRSWNTLESPCFKWFECFKVKKKKKVTNRHTALVTSSLFRWVIIIIII